MKKLILIILCLPIIGFGQDAPPIEMNGLFEAHNECRDNLNLPNLEWCSKLANKSLKWAKKLKRKDHCLHNHSSKKYRKNIGENIAWCKGYTMTSREVANLWISEKKYFDFESRKCKEIIDSCGHYTQMIWRDTKKVGCATVKCGDEQVWVCQYQPAGNLLRRGKIVPAY